jgi:hypothetical protein
LGQRDFIETDVQEELTNLALIAKIRSWLLSDSDRQRISFEEWKQYVECTKMKRQMLEDLPSPTNNPSIKRSRTMELADDCFSRQVSESTPKNFEPTSPKSIKEFFRQLSGCSKSFEPTRPNVSKDPWDVESQNEVNFPQAVTPATLPVSSKLTARERDTLLDREALWKKLAKVIPNMNIRVWKALDFHQRHAIAKLVGIAEIESVIPVEDSVAVRPLLGASFLTSLAVLKGEDVIPARSESANVQTHGKEPDILKSKIQEVDPNDVDQTKNQFMEASAEPSRQLSAGSVHL